MKIFRLLRGPMPMMAVGLTLVILSGAAFIGLVSHSEVDRPGAAALGGLYFLVNTIALGFFIGLEQEMSRSVSQERALGQAVKPVAHLVARQGARLLVPAIGISLAASPVLVPGPLRGHWELIGMLVISLVSAWAASSVRGVLAGCQRFGLYSATLSAEGGSRLVLCVVLWLAGVDSVWAFGLVFVLGQAFAAVLGVVLLWISGQRDWRAPSLADVPTIGGAGTIRFGVSSALTFLVAANLLNQGIINLPPLMVGARSDVAPVLATMIAGAVTLTRLPMFAIFPLQTMLLPRLTAGVAKGDLKGVRRQAGWGVVACVVFGLVGIVILGVAGPQLLSLYLGAPAELSAPAMAALGIGTMFLAISNVTQPTLLALQKHRMVLVSFLVGAVTMVLAFVLPAEPVTSAVLTTAAGPIALVLVMIVVFLRATGRGSRQPVPDDTSTPAPSELTEQTAR